MVKEGRGCALAVKSAIFVPTDPAKHRNSYDTSNITPGTGGVKSPNEEFPHAISQDGLEEVKDQLTAGTWRGRFMGAGARGEKQPVDAIGNGVLKEGGDLVETFGLLADLFEDQVELGFRPDDDAACPRPPARTPSRSPATSCTAGRSEALLVQYSRRSQRAIIRSRASRAFRSLP